MNDSNHSPNPLPAPGAADERRNARLQPGATNLEARGVARSFGRFTALEPTDLTLRPGEIAGLVGPNGSGKSTLLNCLGGLLYPTQGQVRVGGYDLYREEREARRRLAYVPDVPRFYTELTAWEHLRFVALAHDVQEGLAQRAQDLLQRLDLWRARDMFPYAYSRGMQLKLGLACALIRPFEVLLLDEPSSALDPDSTQVLRGILRDVVARGGTVFLSTHDLDLLNGLGGTVYRIDAGRLDGGPEAEP
jgi:ABC-2 type transport system ATP-binding protein